MRERTIVIQEPTVAEGVVSKLPTKTDRRDQNSGMQMFNTTGDTYQLDIFAAPGDSGGPVINSSGKVVAHHFDRAAPPRSTWRSRCRSPMCAN